MRVALRIEPNWANASLTIQERTPQWTLESFEHRPNVIHFCNNTICYSSRQGGWTRYPSRVGNLNTNRTGRSCRPSILHPCTFTFMPTEKAKAGNTDLPSGELTSWIRDLSRGQTPEEKLDYMPNCEFGWDMKIDSPWCTFLNRAGPQSLVVMCTFHVANYSGNLSLETQL